jgi:hypothetical protein
MRRSDIMKSKVKNYIVYREPGHFAGWPANCGIWSWGDEIVTGFSLGRLIFHPEGGHPIDLEGPSVRMQARSVDGGANWALEEVFASTSLPCGESPGEVGVEPVVFSGGVDFEDPDFALTFGRSNLSDGAVSWFFISVDRCRTWSASYTFPAFDLRGIAARTDYVVTGPAEMTLFLTAAKSDGKEGRVFCARTADGGRSFELVSFVGDEPNGFSIMPAALRLSKDSWIAALRRREPPRNFIEIYRSEDDCATWRRMNESIAETGQGGNPPAIIRLRDGHLFMLYGYRDAPQSIRYVTSADEGRSWGDPITVREDGGCSDLGYPRIVERTDGSVLAVYYWNDHPEGERYIGASVFQP